MHPRTLVYGIAMRNRGAQTAARSNARSGKRGVGIPLPSVVRIFMGIVYQVLRGSCQPAIQEAWYRGRCSRNISVFEKQEEEKPDVEYRHKRPLLEKQGSLRWRYEMDESGWRARPFHPLISVTGTGRSEVAADPDHALIVSQVVRYGESIFSTIRVLV